MKKGENTVVYLLSRGEEDKKWGGSPVPLSKDGRIQVESSVIMNLSHIEFTAIFCGNLQWHIETAAVARNNISVQVPEPFVTEYLNSHQKIKRLFPFFNRIAMSGPLLVVASRRLIEAALQQKIPLGHACVVKCTVDEKANIIECEIIFEGF